MSFETALTGLNAAAADLDITGNNIANSSTVGFKYSRAEFADIFASTGSRNAIGQGVRLANVSQQFSQGQFSFTGNSLDVAINGDGFFRMTTAEGQVSYTRAGAFELNREGYVVDSSGRRLTGFLPDGSGGISATNPRPMQVNNGNVAPEATGSIFISANLSSGDDTALSTAFDRSVPDNPPDSYHFSTATTVYDSQGVDHAMTFYFVKTDVNEWELHAYLDGAALGGAATTLEFNPDGSLLAPATLDISGVTVPGADDLELSIDLASLTQYGTPYSVGELRPDGYPAGQFSSLTVEPDGTLFARYTNGQSAALGRIALARFPSPQNLQQVGDNQWLSTFGAGEPIVASAGNSGLGALQAGSLEQSNVNVTEQLINMITAQRNYQANAKMISTQDQITQEILNIR